MAWINFRDIQDRFSHIDAQFVSSVTRFDDEVNEVSITVRFYPWWEHPLYLAAREAGESWGFRGTDEGLREVTVKAIGPVAVNLNPDSMVIEWAFSGEHPILWEFSEHGTIYANGPFDVRELTDRLVARKMPFVQRRDLFPYLDPAWTPITSRGMSLPTQLQTPVLEELAAINVPTFVPRPAGPVPNLIAFLMDDREYVVAEDFVVDVPEFTHEPSWFQPPSSEKAG